MEKEVTVLEALVLAHEKPGFYGRGVTVGMIADACGIRSSVVTGQLKALANHGAAEKSDDVPAFWYITERGLRDFRDAKNMT